MAPLTSSQIAAELQRKRNLGEKPTNAANLGAYNALAPKPAQPKPATPSIGVSQFGGLNNYAASQNNRFQQANQSGNNDLISRLQADSKRVGYALNPYTPKQEVAAQTAPQPTNPTTNDLLTRLNEMMSKQSTQQIPQFNYDANSDPAFQAALSRAKANSQTASGNAQAELNRRGILNSSMTSDRLGQIEQAEYGRVSDTILPQLMQQAYNKHRDSVSDQYTQSRDQLGDLRNLLGMTNDLDQQQTDNQYRENSFNRGVLESDRSYNQGIKESDRNFDQSVKESDRSYEFAQEQYKRGIYENDRDFKENVRQQGLSYALQQKAQSLQAQNMAQDNARGWASINQNKEEFAYKKEQDKLKTPDYDYETDPGFGEDIQWVNNNPSVALQQLKDNAKAFQAKYGVDGYNELIRQATPKKADNPLLKLWEQE